MTQKHVQVFAYAVFLVLSVSTSQAETEKERSRELLPAPKCCCQAESCPACVKDSWNCTSPCEKETALELQLRTVCPIDFKETPLEEALERFRERAGVNIVIDEPALAEAAVNLQRPITLRLDGIPLKKVLQLLLHQLNLAYVVKDEIVLVTTEAHARGKLVNRVYPVEQLVPFAEPVIMEVGSGDHLFGWGTRTDTGPQLLDEPPEDTLIKLLTQNVQPQTWIEQGGLGTIDYFSPCKALVINQTADVQEQIADVLGALRRLAVKEEDPVCASVPFFGLPVPPSAPADPLLPNPPFTLAAPARPIYPQPVPFPPSSLAISPVAPPFPILGLMRAPAPCSALPIQATSAKAYVLEVELRQYQPDGKGINCQRQEIAFCTEHCFHAGLVTREEAGKERRQWLLQVRATVLKNERVRVELVGVQARAEDMNNGRVALDMDATPLMNRRLKLGKKVKMIVDKDQDGKPRKWVELMVKEMPPTPVTPTALPMSAPAQRSMTRQSEDPSH